jgi:hypothetical protein|nr:MAG TPA: hypothetical protein [Caudoviricetes sp.]
MIKDFIKRLNNLGYYELNDIFDLAEIKETDKLKIQKINPCKCAIYIEPKKITLPLNVKKIGFIDSCIVDEVLY